MTITNNNNINAFKPITLKRINKNKKHTRAQTIINMNTT